MPPKQIVIGGGYEGEMTPELEQLTQDLQDMALCDLTPLELDLQNQINTLRTRMSFIRDRRAQINQEQALATAKAKAKAKSIAMAQELANRRAGAVNVLTCSMPNMNIQTIEINKDKTVGKLKGKVVRRGGQYPTYGKRGGLRKDDLLAILPNGQVLPPRKAIYNIPDLCGDDPRIVLIENANYDPAVFQFPDFDAPVDVAEVDEEDDDDDSEDEQ